MEAQYLTNKEGERIGVFLDMERYEAARRAERDAAQKEKELRTKESVLSELIGQIRSFDAETYEHLLAIVEEKAHANAESPEEAQARLDIIEDFEAAAAMDEDVEKMLSGEANAIPWERSKARRRGDA